MALSSQNSQSAPLPPSEVSQDRTSSLHPDSSVNAAGEDAVYADKSEHQDSRHQDDGSDADIGVETVNNRQEGNQSTNVRVRREESIYGDDEEGGSGVESDSVDYGDGEFEILREGIPDGSVSPSYSSLRVEPDLEDSQSHLRLEEIFEGDGSATASDVDLVNLSEPFAVSELELLERALQSLQKSHKHGRQEIPGGADGETDDVGVDERGPPSPDYSGDLTGVSRLLKKVQAVRAQKRDAIVTRRRDTNRSPRPRSTSTTGDQPIDFADMREVVQAASRVAFSAAKAAEAMVNSLDRNSQAIEELCRTLTCTTTEEISLKQKGGAGVENNDGTNFQLLKLQQSELDIELRQAEVTKSLLRQNRLTHWILGFMVVTTFAWRFGVVKVARRVNDAVSNPFEKITGVLDNFKGKNNKDKKDGSRSKGLNLSSLLPGDSDDDKDGELPFNIGKIMPHTGTDTEVHASASASAHAHSSENNTDGPFNIGKILPGRGDSTDDE